jgi:hypothetical protein
VPPWELFNLTTGSWAQVWHEYATRVAFPLLTRSWVGAGHSGYRRSIDVT